MNARTSARLAVALLTAAAAAIGCAAPLRDVPADRWAGAQTLPVPDVRQSTTYSCGAAALQAVIAYWGIEKREGELVRLLGSSEDRGTGPTELVRVARELGLTADLVDGMPLDELRATVARGTPVIVSIQAWVADPAHVDWTATWEDGHYVIVTGLDDEYVFVEDPSLLGTRGFIPLPQFLDRWHDYVGDPPRDPSDRTYVHLAVVIEGAAPAPPPAFSAVE